MATGENQVSEYFWPYCVLWLFTGLKKKMDEYKLQIVLIAFSRQRQITPQMVFIIWCSASVLEKLYSPRQVLLCHVMQQKSKRHRDIMNAAAYCEIHDASEHNLTF